MKEIMNEREEENGGCIYKGRNDYYKFVIQLKESCVSFIKKKAASH